MKVYNLSCEYKHRFEGWFSSEEDFNAQAAKGLLVCPLCDSRSVARVPAAPRLNLGKAKDGAAKGETQVAMLQRAWLEAARKVVAETEDVGERFADEARRIHYKEAPERGIRGIATGEEREALADEGIEVMSMPLPAALKLPVQ